MTNATTENTTIKMYKEETTCKNCGRHIRNVVEIDGVQLGTKCAEGFLPRNLASAAKKDFAAAARDFRVAELKALKSALLNYATQIDGDRFAQSPTSFLEDIVARARSRYLLAQIARLEARKMDAAIIEAINS